MSTEGDKWVMIRGIPFEAAPPPLGTFSGEGRPAPTPKRGPKKPGRHQWHQVRPGERPKHRRTQGPGGLVICLRRGCMATKGLNGRVYGPAACERLYLER